LFCFLQAFTDTLEKFRYPVSEVKFKMLVSHVGNDVFTK
jgi:hypothetical protein